jgi:HAD superfamily hydrolase (TIGR01458 family)
MGFMSAIRGFLIDLDGVLYTGDIAIPGADEAISFMNENGYSYRFVSNTTRKCRRSIAERLSRMGFEIPEAYIFTPPIAAVAYMKKTGRCRFRLLVTGDVFHDFLLSQDDSIKLGKDYIVIGDAGDEITYATLNRAFRDIIGGAEIIALENDRFWMAPDGLSLSAGPFVAALEFATGKKAVLMGKPSEEFFNLALDDMGIDPEHAVMIGDDIQTDVGGAQSAGMRGILVRTGKFQEEVVRKSCIRPDLIIDSIRDIRKVVDAALNESWDTSLL